MSDRKLLVTNPDGTVEWRDFPATSQAVRMEPGRAQWLADHSLLLPDGSIQPGVYTAEHLAPLITRPEEDWKIEKLLAVGQSRAWVLNLIDAAAKRALELAPSTGVSGVDIGLGQFRWQRIVTNWPYGQALQPMPHPMSVVMHPVTATSGGLPDGPLNPSAILTEARVREIVRDEIAKAK